MFDKFRPLGDRVLVERVEEQQQTASGLFIPSVAQEKAQTGKVKAVGTGRVDASGKVSPLHVKVGDLVYFGKYSGTDAGEYLIVREDEILGIIE